MFVENLHLSGLISLSGIFNSLLPLLLLSRLKKTQRAQLNPKLNLLIYEKSRR